ncbi:hypothetical protein SBA2_670051 [Acidobacteriia bacterium SbA2]|nr:hypothetical protein SBA2_670051 [Acidobacteriia bacterium SbA2]
MPISDTPHAARLHTRVSSSSRPEKNDRAQELASSGDEAERVWEFFRGAQWPSCCFDSSSL